MSPRRWRRAAAYGAYLVVVSAAGAYALFTVQRAASIYETLKGPRRGFSGRLYRADPDLGWTSIPGARGEMVFPSRPPLPVRFDQDGFRVPAEGPELVERRRPLVLALGCSFTFGDACRAEEAYPHLLARALGGTEINAGLCGGSLAQMLIQARRLIPRYRPDYVVVQYSPWLLKRGSTGFGKSTFGLVTAPYFYWRGAALEIHPPLPGTAVFGLPFHDFESDRRGAGEFASFLFRAGAPLLLHDDWLWLRHRVQLRRGEVPAPADENPRVLPLVYGELAGLCARHGARMVVARLSQPMENRPIRLPGLEGVTLVDPQAELNALAGDAEAYDRKFRHWSAAEGLVDPHPNAAAHQVIAASIARALSGSGAAAR